MVLRELKFMRHAADEPMETLGEKLALPPFLEKRRAEIERGLKPLVV